jgi:cobalt-zinc-cadmium efflux system outer membrane protein
MRHMLALLLAGIALPAHAQSGDLPPPDLVVRALDTQPTVAAAIARVDAARAEGDALRRGSHEVTAQGTLSRRTIDRDGDYAEFDTTVSRAFRLPGKAALDRSSGQLGIAVATNRMEDARHQAALVLAQLWYDWLRATDLHRNAIALVENQRALVHMTDRRVALRDAARLDLEQANVALALAQTQVGDAAADRDRAHALLATRFPELPLPAEPPSLAEPEIPSEGFEHLQALIVERSHEIGAAAGQAERRAVMARRARADRIADPSLGVRLFSERGGEERGAGLYASLPFGGGHRRALADQASAEATAALADRNEVEREVASNAAADVAEARGRLSAWQSSREAVRRAQESAALSARGQSLGAIDLVDRLYAERQANEARAAEIAARAAAARLILKLRIDAHTLWIDE